MSEILLKIPQTCEKCEAQNFKIHGVVYNETHNYTKIGIKCMRCGQKSFSVEQPHD